MAMKKAALEDWRQKHELTQVNTGEFFGYERRQLIRFLDGAYPVPRNIEIIIALMEKFKLSPGDVEKILERRR